MGASRKLQGEIDRVLKKVQEGVDVFDSIWNKVYDTDNANQKEKFEADLKKEIKKLQRYRDQIKTWIQSSDIKDKKVSASYEQALMDARKLIEREMERFKICEKETKTKAFSKEGLGQQPKTDPKEKAKAETRDWLNNVVSELESQIDSYEAEIEGLTVKKGKMKPRLTHLETSIVRHKAHIIKLELILRLLDNDELSPEQVNDVKDFLDDYVERNQDDFDEFSDVDELYSSLPLDKVEALEDLVTIGPPGLVKGAGSTSLSLKTSLAVSSSQITAAATPALQQGSVTEEQSLEIDTQENSDVKTPSQKTSVVGSSGPSTPVGGNAAPVLSLAMQTLTGASITASTLPGSISGRDVMEHTAAAVSSTPSVDLPASTKEEDLGSFTGHRPSSLPMDSGIMKGAGRGSLASQASASVLLGSNSTIPNNGNITPTDMAKRNILSTDGRIGNSGMVQPLVSPLSNRMILSQATKLNEGTLSADSSSGSEAAAIAGRVFPSSVVSGTQWRSGSPFQTQNEVGQVRGRTELAPDQKENFLQRLQQIQQQGHSNLIGMPPLAGGNHKPFSAQQQNPLLQQFASQTPSVSSQVNIGNGVQGPSPSTVASNSMQLQLNPVYQPSQQTMMSIGSKEADVGLVKAEEQKQSVIDEAVKSVHASGKNIINEDDSRSLYTTDTPVVSSSLTEPTQLARDADLSPGQPLQPNPQSGSLGVIGRRSVSDLGAIGDNLGGSSVNSGVHDQLYNMQMLEAMYYKLPHPKDSERPRSYVPKHPVATPASYPQVQAPIVNNPVFWERLGVETLGTDTLFFAFYYQQNTYQQYLAAKELKKQSWRYHRKYNTWFQRHEEPKVATDEFEQGTYVYFDFHIADDNLQHGWCQRIKTEFTFEYNYLEDEL